MDDLPELIRERIKNILNNNPISVPQEEEILHILTSISYQMYRAGWKDALKVTKKSIEINEKLIDGKNYEEI